MFFALKFVKDDHFETKDIEVGNFDELLTVSSEILSCAFNEISGVFFTDGTLIDENNYLQTLQFGQNYLSVLKTKMKTFFLFFTLKDY